MSAPQRRKGKPNRGGGRFNSSRGSGGGGGGRGRGRGVQRGRGGGGGHGGGGFCGGKKGGDSAAAMGYLGDSVVVGRDDYDDYDNTPRFVTTLQAICLLDVLELRPTLPAVTPLKLRELCVAFPAVTPQHCCDARRPIARRLRVRERRPQVLSACVPGM